MKICGACERQLPDGSFSEEERVRRQSIRRCEECVATGNQLVLMKKGRTRSEEDDCPICQLPLPLDVEQFMFKVCCMKKVCSGCILASVKRGMRDCPFCRAPKPDESQALAMIRKRVDKGDPLAIFNLGNKYCSGQYGLVKDVTRTVRARRRARGERSPLQSWLYLCRRNRRGERLGQGTPTLRGGSNVRRC